MIATIRVPSLPLLAGPAEVPHDYAAISNTDYGISGRHDVRKLSRFAVFFFSLTLVFSAVCQAQQQAGSAPTRPSISFEGPSQADLAKQSEADAQKSEAPKARARRSSEPSIGEFGRIGVGVKISTLGIGGEVATAVTHSSNVRMGFNAFSYSRGFAQDGVNYNGSLTLRSVEAHFDWFPFAGSFHISPGVMAYNGNQVKGNATVLAGQAFSLGNGIYTTDPANPMIGTGKIDFARVAPTFLVGWGNLLPRHGRRWSIPVEIGFAYQGQPRATLALAGGVCDVSLTFCRSVASDPTVQANILAEQTKINNNLSLYKFYPVISVGFGYKF